MPNDNASRKNHEALSFMICFFGGRFQSHTSKTASPGDRPIGRFFSMLPSTGQRLAALPAVSTLFCLDFENRQTANSDEMACMRAWEHDT
jgi:hypothetical protein